MRRNGIGWAMAGALLLAGCGQEAADYNRVEVPERQARAEAAIEQAVAASGPRQAARAGLPVSTPTPNAARARALPTEFQGYWGITPGDCELANYQATGRININADTIRFHEARATVSEVREASPARVFARLAFSGEGQRWERLTRFALEAGGTRLVRTELPSGGTTRYQRC